MSKHYSQLILSKTEYQDLLDAYQKLGQILNCQKTSKIKGAKTGLKTLYGIWQDTKINEKDFTAVKKSLFKLSL